MSDIVQVRALDGTPFEFVNEVKGQGGMKDVYFSPDRSYVVAWFRTPADATTRDRLVSIAGLYRDRIFNQDGGNYWHDVYCWPTHVVELNNRLGIVAPFFKKHFFFEHGARDNTRFALKGQEKQGKWFASARHRNRTIDPRERGTWLTHLRICLLISRAVRRLHAAGLAHSDLSYKNVLVDPTGGNACVIDLDGLVVPGRYPPDVAGTPDFIAPEVLSTAHLPWGDPARKLPRIETDRHALAVLIYMYLFYRHPLRGRKVHAADAQTDELLSMGSNALFVEHPQDATNRPNIKDVTPYELPWADPNRMPYTIAGSYLKPLFDRAFIGGLHDPAQRPTADEWETALIKTVDLLQPCLNDQCEQKWYVFDNSTRPMCPFCGTPFRGQLPVLNLYSNRGKGKFLPDNHRVMVYTNQYLYAWHANRNVYPNERLTGEARRPVGYFVFHGGRWLFRNQRLPDMRDMTRDAPVPIDSTVDIADGKQFLLSNEDGGRLVHVQMVTV